MKTNIYFIRHAQPDLSVHDDLKRPLTEEGLKSRKKLVDFFEDKQIDTAYSSPFKRAIDTIDPIAINKNLSLTIINNFRERKIGDNWIPNFHEFCEKQWKNFNYKLVNGESLAETQQRNIQSLIKVIEKNIGKTVIIGGHGTAIGTIINYFDHNFKYEQFKKIQPIMPFIVELNFDKLNFEEYQIVEIR